MSYMIKAIPSRLVGPISTYAAMIKSNRMYSIKKQTTPVIRRDWMDADESDGYVLDAIRSINEDTINPLGGFESLTYTQETIRSVLQDPNHNPVSQKIHRVCSSIQCEHTLKNLKKIAQPSKADWLDAEDFHLAIEAIRTFKSDTVNSLSQSPIHTATKIA